ncbi:MAG: glutaredoxin [Bdellovibrionales bacterium]|nr:glutaredoxin [Bdellovibrionales bacterium]
MKNVKIYIKPTCPFCIRVKRFLEGKGLPFDEVDVSQNPELYRNLKLKTEHQTVPQIFFDDVFVGGSDEFFKAIEGQSIQLD